MKDPHVMLNPKFEDTERLNIVESEIKSLKNLLNLLFETIEK